MPIILRGISRRVTYRRAGYVFRPQDAEMEGLTYKKGERAMMTNAPFYEKQYGCNVLADNGMDVQPLYPARVTYDDTLENKTEVQTGCLLDEPLRCWPIENGGLLLNGWDVSAEGGGLHSAQDGSFCLVKTSKLFPVVIQKRFVLQTSGVLDATFLIGVDNDKLAGSGMYICYGDMHVIGLIFSDTCIQLLTNVSAPVNLVPYHACDRYGVRLTIDMNKKTVSAMIDGKETNITLSFDAVAINRVKLIATGEGTGCVNLPLLTLHKGYTVHEHFFTALSGCLPDDWQNRGEIPARIVEVPSESGSDRYSLGLFSNATSKSEVCKRFHPLSQGEYSFKFFAESQAACFCFQICGSDSDIKLIVREQGIFLQSEQLKIYDYCPGVWFKVSLTVDYISGKAKCQINYKDVCTFDVLTGMGATGICFAASGNQAAVLIDDVTVKPVQVLPDDYVPVPEPPAKKNPDLHIGMLRCDLWHSTDHLGWDRINQFENNIRKPLMGWYDDGSPEAADWETKFMVEHGITFQMNCWYRPYGTVGKPFKTTLHGEALHDGYLQSQYSNYLKFALFITTARGEIAGSDDFRKNIVPFLIEYYLKDDRYLVIDNKPVIALYDYACFRDDVGGSDEDAERELEYLRNCCRKIGYDGAIIIASVMPMQTENNRIALHTSCDLTCAYGWGLPFSDSASAQLAIAKDTRSIDGLYNLVGSLTVGFDFYPWDRSNTSSLLSAQEFKQACLMMTNEYLPGFPKDSLAGRIVMVDNWNEFSEGHFINPTGVNGFGYLEAIREVFTFGGEHTDVIPTKAQQNRIGILYPQSRLLEHAPRYPRIPDLDECNRVVWEDKFINTTAFSPVTANAFCADAYIQNGCLHIKPSRRSFVCIQNRQLDIPAEDVVYIRVILKGDTSDYNGKLYFSLDGEDFDYLYGGRLLRLWEKHETQTEYICDIGRGTIKGGKFFSGRLTGLNLWFFSGGREVDVVSVQALGN